MATSKATRWMLAGLLVVAAAAGCKRGKSDRKSAKGAGPAGRPGPSLKLTAETAGAWVPKGAAGSAYQVKGAPKIYLPDTLHELLNGGADMYVEAGMTATGYVELDDKNGKASRCQIFLFMMKDKAKAASLLQTEKDKNFKPFSVGDQGFDDGQGVLFVKGRFFVRIDSPPSEPGAAGCPYREVARSVASTKNLPWE